MDFLKRTWAQINLDAITSNFKALRQRVDKKTQIMCIVKADGYGHGAQYVSKELESAGADCFGVSNLEEALQLRNSKITKPILILGYTPAEYVKKLHDYDITQTVFSRQCALMLSNMAEKMKVKINIHIKLDTGMGRIGIPCTNDSSEAVETILEICKMKGIAVKGIYTHFAMADTESALTKNQFSLFINTVKAAEKAGAHFELKHCCNSAAALRYPEMHLDMIRPGIILYGLTPCPLVKGSLPLTPAMELKSVIAMTKKIEKGQSIGYGHKFTAQGETIVATLPIGYADGYCRSMSGKASMLVKGHKAPVIGTISMDQCMIDITGIPDVKQGTVVTAIGREGKNEISVDELSAICNTINYETVCLIGKRVPRIYIKNGKEIGQLNYILK